MTESDSNILILKHLILIVLFCGIVPFVMDIVRAIDTVEGSQNQLDPYILLITVSGLVLAGALSGFFQFSFNRTNDETDKYRRTVLLILGHFITGFMMLVIGTLLIVCVVTLTVGPIITFNNNAIGKQFDICVSMLAIILYAAMVGYDIYDNYAEPSRIDSTECEEQ